MAAASTSGWEYLILERSEADRLNDLGREGWELVAVSQADDGVELFLKRPLPGFREQITLDQRSSYVTEGEE
ncbi:MAG: hypothetical protein M3Z20_02505 [Chloroflexota bacterium]|nr:hypothetical protein [Chloroflexota bacterium]